MKTIAALEYERLRVTGHAGLAESLPVHLVKLFRAANKSWSGNYWVMELEPGYGPAILPVNVDRP